MSFNWSDPQFANLFSDLGKPAPPAPFVPAFESGIVYRSQGKGDLPVNDEYYATASTAAWLASKFGAARVHDPNLPGQADLTDSANPGPDGADVYAVSGVPAYSRMLVFQPGSVIRNYVGAVVSIALKQFSLNAGELAKFYRNLPEDKYPAFTEVIGAPPNVVSLQVQSLAEQYAWRELLLRSQS
jgi:hypothetical protein